MSLGKWKIELSEAEFEQLPDEQKRMYHPVWQYDHPVFGAIDAFSQDYLKYPTIADFEKAMSADTQTIYRLKKADTGLNKRAFTTVKEAHHYQVPAYEVVVGEGIRATGDMIDIRFVRGSKVINENREPALAGTLHEHLISVSIEDLKLKHTEFPSKETDSAITHLQEALHWLEEREKARASQGVLGTYQPHKS